MKFDKFLAALFSRKAIAIILLVVLAAFCLTACELTLEDVLCLSFCGCLSLDTCRNMIMSSSCGDCGGSGGCNNSCVGDAYNEAFGCVWDAGLKNCQPSQACSKCEGDGEEIESFSCDECMLDCLDGCVRNLENVN